MDRFPVGLEMDVSFPNFQVSLTLLSVTQLRFEIKEGPFARAEIVDILPDHLMIDGVAAYRAQPRPTIS